MNQAKNLVEQALRGKLPSEVVEGLTEKVLPAKPAQQAVQRSIQKTLDKMAEYCLEPIRAIARDFGGTVELFEDPLIVSRPVGGIAGAAAFFPAIVRWDRGTADKAGFMVEVDGFNRKSIMYVHIAVDRELLGGDHLHVGIEYAIGL